MSPGIQRRGARTDPSTYGRLTYHNPRSLYGRLVSRPRCLQLGRGLGAADLPGGTGRLSFWD